MIPSRTGRIPPLAFSLLTGLALTWLLPGRAHAQTAASYNWSYPMFSSEIQPVADRMYAAVTDAITSPLITMGLIFAAVWSIATMWRSSGANPIADVARALVAVVCISSGQFLFNEINFVTRAITMLPQQNLIDAGMSPFIGFLPYEASTEANAKRRLGSKGVQEAQQARAQRQTAYLEMFSEIGGAEYEEYLEKLRRKQPGADAEDPSLWEIWNEKGFAGIWEAGKRAAGVLAGVVGDIPGTVAGTVMTVFSETIAALFGAVAALITLLLLMYRMAALGLLYVLFPLAAALFVFPWRPLQMVLPNLLLNYFVLRLWDFAFAVVLAFWTPMMIAVADKMSVMGGLQLAAMSLILPIIMLTIPRIMASLFAAGLGNAVSGMAASTVMFYGVMMRMAPTGGGGSAAPASAPSSGGGGGAPR